MKHIIQEEKAVFAYSWTRTKRPGASLSRIGLLLQDFTPQKMLKCNVELSKRGIALMMIMARLLNSIKQCSLLMACLNRIK